MASHLRKQKNDYLRLALTLFIVAALTGAILSVVHYLTNPVADHVAKERLDQSLVELMGEDAIVEPVPEFTREIVLGKVHVPVESIYLGKDADKALLGYCVHVKPTGYSGIVEMMVGLDGEGVVKAVEILSLNESPGIGTKIKTNDAFRSNLIGLSDSAKIVKHLPKNKDEVQVISGATASSAAYINGVNAAIEAIQILRAEEVLK